MKILLGHTVHSPENVAWYGEIAAAAPPGLDVRPFCVTLSPPGPRHSFRELDALWKSRDKALFDMYRRLQSAAEDCDVFLLYNGANVHPEFLACLPTFNVFCCFDDPESSADLSAPVAASFDAAFFGNVAARFQYQSWGCRRLEWLPVFTAPGDVPSRAEGEALLDAARDVDIALVCGNNAYRRRRIESLAREFPQVRLFGEGWSAGRIDAASMRAMYARTRIGWNVHNSTGPINRRLFVLPAFGVLQLCDNKTGLAEVFDLGKEVVGFDTIPEAVALTRHYLAREDERREIAANGWKRFWRDYRADAIWERIRRQLEAWTAGGSAPRRIASPLPALRRSPAAARLAEAVARGARRFRHALRDPGQPGAPPVARPRLPDESVALEEEVPPYAENPEMKGVNMARERLARGEPLEWPNMLAQNWAVTSLIRRAKRIAEIGSGTGPFAWYASADRSRLIHCFEEDDFAREWAIRNRSVPNVRHFKDFEGNILDGGYDLVVAIDVIEHVADTGDFLRFCSVLAPRALFTTPNRSRVRPPGDTGPPAYPPHVREFDPGEFYWILKQHYETVLLYHTPDVHVPWLEPMDISGSGTPIVAECRRPLAAGRSGR